MKEEALLVYITLGYKYKSPIEIRRKEKERESKGKKELIKPQMHGWVHGWMGHTNSDRIDRATLYGNARRAAQERSIATAVAPRHVISNLNDGD